MKVSKGLEFPVVALPGTGMGHYLWRGGREAGGASVVWGGYAAVGDGGGDGFFTKITLSSQVNHLR